MATPGHDLADRFVTDGLLRIDGAFPHDLAAELRRLLWPELGCDPGDPATWTRAVVRLGDRFAEPSRRAASAPVLHAAFDALVGPGRWLPRASLGSVVVRFPSDDDPGDRGWHVDASFSGPGSAADDYLTWRVNVRSRGRALLMLFLLSDVGDDDAPTRLRAGSHADIARLLAPAGEHGLSALELGHRIAAGVSALHSEALATGPAGTVYLCHPFLVHAAQWHRGAEPRFLAQPPLLPAAPLELRRADGRYAPVERAIRTALRMA
jgi:hypothetical protein